MGEFHVQAQTAGISVVILATLNTVGSRLNAKFDEIPGLLQ
jgi:Flp pilus assembly pilin Flp